MTRKYEMVYVLNPTLGEEELQNVNNRIAEIVNQSGKVESVESWGRKRLAYEIDDQREGLYSVMLFTAETEAPKEIDRLLKIVDGVLRFLIVRTGESGEAAEITEPVSAAQTAEAAEAVGAVDAAAAEEAVEAVEVESAE